MTLPGIESFLLGECKAVGVEVAEVGDGWVEARGDPTAALAHCGTLRAAVEVQWRGPAADLLRAVPRLRHADRLWFEAQWVNEGARAAAVRDTVARLAGGPERIGGVGLGSAAVAATGLDGPPGLVCVVDRHGGVLVGQALAWGCERRRPYRVALMARSLNPAMARALAMASRAREGDVFLDPFCGSGTVLAERAMLGPCRLVGVDADAAAVDAAGRTLSGFMTGGSVSADVRAGDARDLAFLGAGEVQAVACNPPFGHRMGRGVDNADLYPAALREAARVLRPRGRLVVLTADRRHLRQAVAACGPALRLRSEARVWLGGLEPTLGVYDRTDRPVP